MFGQRVPCQWAGDSKCPLTASDLSIIWWNRRLVAVCLCVRCMASWLECSAKLIICWHPCTAACDSRVFVQQTFSTCRDTYIACQLITTIDNLLLLASVVMIPSACRKAEDHTVCFAAYIQHGNTSVGGMSTIDEVATVRDRYTTAHRIVFGNL